MAVLLDSGDVLCEQCGDGYERIGTHWSKSSNCNHPELGKVWKEVLVGIVMSDGCVKGKSSKNQYVNIAMINKPFIKWLNDVFGWFSTGVYLRRTSEEGVEKVINSGFRPDAKVEDYHDVYEIRTRSHPFITSLTGWYSSGSKVWPKTVEITPTVLLMLYVGDGSYDDGGRKRRIKISMKNEVDNESKIIEYFNRKNVPYHSSWNGGDAQWSVKSSYELFDYMTQSPLWTGPPPGFKYKFPENFGGTGKDMSDLS